MSQQVKNRYDHNNKPIDNTTGNNLSITNTNSSERSRSISESFRLHRPSMTQQQNSSRLSINLRMRKPISDNVLNLGDTSVYGLGTMHITKASRSASQARVRVINRKAKSRTESLRRFWYIYRELAYHNTWFNPLVILIIVYSSFLISGNYTETNPLFRFVSISYNVPNSNRYRKGFNDICFVFYHMVFFTFLREFVMQKIMLPITQKINMRSQHKIKRTMEQAYSVVYYSVASPAGVILLYKSELWFFKTKELFLSYPDITIPRSIKWYYLLQASFWAQQAAVLILQLEKPRKDQNELIYHHIVTLSLISMSYMFHFTKIGLEVYVTMDISDLLLATSKTLNYFAFPYTPIVFAMFVSSWIYFRHYINARILWAVLTEYRTVGNYTLNFATEQYKCWISQPIVFLLIFALQLVNLYWLYLIFRVIRKVLFEGVQQDNRSDNSDNDASDASSTTGSSISSGSISSASINEDNTPISPIKEDFDDDKSPLTNVWNRKKEKQLE